MAPDGILETALYVDDLDAAESFYGNLIGLKKIAEVAGRHIFFRCGDGVLLLFVAKQSALPSHNPAMPVPPHGASGPGHACFRAAGDQLDQWRRHLEENDIAIETDFLWPTGARSIYFRDPAGNSLEISEPKLWGFE